MGEIDELEPREGKYWNGTYKDIGYRVQLWTSKDFNGELNYIWNYYIYINLKNLSPDVAKRLWLRAKLPKLGKNFKRKLYRYYDEPLLNNIEMHGGITWYKKMYSISDEKVIEIGCDFNHDGDNYDEYDLRLVLSDVKNCIDTLPPELLANQSNKEGE